MFDQALTVRAPRIGRRRFAIGCFSTMTAVAALMIAQRPALAGPTGGTVVDGSAGISQSGSVTNINQSSSKAIINWQGFSIGANETVNFNQPGRSSVTLNRVIGNETSIISGALNANGQVFIVNTAGVLFGKGAQVNVGGLVASTLDISNADFMAGNYAFSGNSSASIVNQGRIRAHGSGYVALLGKTVSNDGVISARLGTVAMASGSKITLNFGGNSLVDVTIDEGTLNALVENKRAIRADGGQVIMTAKAADQVLSAQVNNSGVIQARTMAALTGGSGKQRAAKTGSIKLFADGGTTNVSGKLDASAPKGGDGGSIETSGNKVHVADGAIITTKSATGKIGTWLIDPDGFMIAATGGDISGATLSANLASSDIKLASTQGSGTDGNINVNDAVSWSTNSTLTLNATNNINIKSDISAVNGGLTLNAGNQISATAAVNVGTFILSSGTWSQVLGQDTLSQTGTLPGFSAHDFRIATGASFLRAAGGGGTSANPYQIADVYGLQGIGSSTTLLSNSFVLANDIDASGTATWNSNGAATPVYAGFNPIGTAIPKGSTIKTNFTGVFDGNDHVINGLTINNPKTTSTGLFGVTDSSSVIRDIGLTDVNIRGTKVGATSAAGVGALVGQNFGNISHAYSSGTVTGFGNVGGLIGVNGSSSSAVNTISDSSSTASVSGSAVGGLIGRAFNVNIYRSSANGNVTATADGGGLIGNATNINVYDSHAGNLPGMTVTSTVTGGSSVTGLGGLIGNLSSGATGPGIIENSYANVNVSGGYQLGGLVGVLTTKGADYTIENSSAGGNVSGSQTMSLVSDAGIGGLVGNAISLSGNATIFIRNSSATGAVGFMNPDGTPATFGNFAGGLVGLMTGRGVIDNSSAHGAVTGSTTGSAFGGLVGADSAATTIRNSHAFGAVSGNRSVGGLAGTNSGTVTNSDASGSVVGNNNVGGLVGSNSAPGSITGSFATGSVTGQLSNSETGGLVGTNTGSISNSYASGLVTGPSGTTGGLVGENFGGGSITNSYYNSDLNSGLNETGSFTPVNQKPGTVKGGGGLSPRAVRRHPVLPQWHHQPGACGPGRCGSGGGGRSSRCSPSRCGRSSRRSQSRGCSNCPSRFENCKHRRHQRGNFGGDAS